MGDIRHYPGKRKLILSSLHAATLAAFDAATKGPQSLAYNAPVIQRLGDIRWGC